MHWCSGALVHWCSGALTGVWCPGALVHYPKKEILGTVNIKKIIIVRRTAFTLIELMIVIVIIGILAISAVAIYRANRRRAVSAEGFAALGAIRNVQRLYLVEWNTYLATDNIDRDLGLDTVDNYYWNTASFKVEPGPGGIGNSFIATATGDNSTAFGRAEVKGIILTMNEQGEITGP